jgi:Protein of unknown function (DUF3089)
MKKKLLIGVAVLAVLAGLAFVFRDVLLFGTMYLFTKPGDPFSAATIPPAPDYAEPQYWAALPDRADLADTLPGPAIHDGQADAPVDVFFVHPTTYYSRAGWNQPLPDAKADAITDGLVLRGQAAVFNTCCRVYAPRYRQATLFSFFDESGGGGQALDVAYGDVTAAFDYFLEHFSQGRPFILASHSQGSRHLARLLHDRFADGPLAQRLVAAYPIGYPVKRADLPARLPVCDAPNQTGCVATWSSVGPAAGSYRPTHDDICVNPLSWRADGERADFALNEGGVSFGPIAMNAAPAEMLAPRVGRILPGIADAQCVDGRLLISAIRSDRVDMRIPLGRDNYHLYDYALFSMNLRANADRRVAAYLAAHPAAANPDTSDPAPGSR